MYHQRSLLTSDDFGQLFSTVVLQRKAKLMEAKTSLLNDLWPSAVADVIGATLDELDDLENWMASSLKTLV